MGCSTSTTAFDDPSQLQQQTSQQNQSLGARYVNKKSGGKQQDGDEKIVDEVLNRIGGGDEKDSAITRINGVLHGPSIHTDNIFDVAVTNNPHQILTCSDDRTIVRYDWKRGIVMDRWVGHTKCVNQVVYGDMSGVILSASRDTTIRTWSTSSSTSTSTLSGHKLSITALDICKVDNTMCVSGGRDFSVRFWDVETGVCRSMKEIQLNVVTGLCWLPQDPSCVLQISEDLEMRVWDQRSMSVVQTFQDGPYFALGCDASPDGNTFVTSANGFQGTGCEIRIWDRRKGTLRRTLTGHTETVPSVCFMPEIRTQSGTDVCLLASGSKDQTIKLWDIDAEDACLATSSIPNSLTMQCLAQFPLASPTTTSTTKRDPMSLLYVGCVAGFVSTWSVNHTRRDLHLIARSKGNEDEKK